MPLMPGRSKKAFKKNVETEMEHGKPQKQSLAIAYDMKKKKKYAKGGPVSAKSERRPNADEQDMSELSRNRGDKPAHMDKATSRPETAQSTKGQKTTAIKHPKMVPSSVFSTKLRDQEDDLEDSAKPASPDEHIMMASGGEINELEPMVSAEQDNDEHPPGLESDNDMMDDSDAMNDHMTMMAEGGQAEMEADHHDSIAAAIMAKRGLKRLMQDSGSHDDDHATMMAEGGEAILKENSTEQPNGYYARNKAALKENLDADMDDAHTPMDGEDGDEREDNRGNKKDQIEEMRRRAMSRRNFNK